MSYSELIVYLIEIIGTIAFASSGAMIAIEKNMDIFGINVLALTTALGGGLIRDLILGITPPNMFRDSSYAIVAIVTACLMFIICKIKKEWIDIIFRKHEYWLVIMDAVGLGAFTVIGINTAWSKGYKDAFLLIFVGVITGVGGGVLRDLMAQKMPFIFVRHIYACASLVGAIMFLILVNFIPMDASMIIAAVIIVIIRCLAAHYKWNLPKP